MAVGKPSSTPRPRASSASTRSSRAGSLTCATGSRAEGDGSKLSRRAPRIIETVEQPEDGLCAGFGPFGVLLDLLRLLFQPGDHRRVDLLVAKQDLAVELARLLLKPPVPLLTL